MQKKEAIFCLSAIKPHVKGSKSYKENFDTADSSTVSSFSGENDFWFPVSTQVQCWQAMPCRADDINKSNLEYRILATTASIVLKFLECSFWPGFGIYRDS